jgi:hypothetical protein
MLRNKRVENPWKKHDSIKLEAAAQAPRIAQAACQVRLKAQDTRLGLQRGFDFARGAQAPRHASSGARRQRKILNCDRPVTAQCERMKYSICRRLHHTYRAALR